MATLVHPSSAESTTSQLDLFSVPPSQTSLEDGSFTKYHPVSVLTSTGPIEFTVSAKNSNYIDLANSFLYVRVSVTTSNGVDLAKTAEIAPECNFLHTLWSQVDVYLNGLLVTQSKNNYPYRAYIDNLYSFGQEGKILSFPPCYGIAILMHISIVVLQQTRATPSAKLWLQKAKKSI